MSTKLYLPSYPSMAEGGIEPAFKQSGGNADGSVPFSFERNFNSDAIGSTPADLVLDYGGEILSGEVAAWYAGQKSTWNPSGFTRAFTYEWDTFTEWHIIDVPIGQVVPLNVELNLEMLMCCQGTLWTTSRGHHSVEIRNAAVTEKFYATAATYERAQRGAIMYSSVLENYNGTENVAADRDQFLNWTKVRLTVAPDGVFTASTTMAATGEVLYDMAGTFTNIASVGDMNTLRGGHGGAVSSEGKAHIARLYVGDSSLGWPSDD